MKPLPTIRWFIPLLILLPLSFAAEGTPNDSSGQLSEKSQPTKDDFPLRQEGVIRTQPGNVRGFAMLAQYEDGGPGRVWIQRTSTPGRAEPFPPVALVRVIDPEGNLVKWTELTDSQERNTTRIIDIPEGPAGIWRVSFSGGRNGDRIEIGLPQTDVWGVRGEMVLGVTATTPNPSYLWVPPTAERMMVALESGRATGGNLADTSGRPLTSDWEADPARRIGRLVLDTITPDSVVRLTLPSDFRGGIFVEGVPGLLCPTEEAAEILRGGLVESHGIWVGGPLQARARDWMVRYVQDPSFPDLDFSGVDTETLNEPLIDALAFGRYGALNNLGGIIDAQNRNLDPDSPFLGSNAPEDHGVGESSWANFAYERTFSWMDASTLAAAVAFPSAANPVWGNDALVDRATLSAFYHLASLQGDDLLRDSDLWSKAHPMVLAFFIYPGALTQAYWQLEEYLSPEAREIWKQGMMAVGDKSADFTAYMSNQWAHMIRGHLEVYLATGEERFLGYFERMMNAYLDNVHGVNSNFGQHQAGYFLENGGPDGNYDRMNTFCLVSSYWDYRDLPDADPVLVEKMREGIEKNLEFRSFFWLPQPSGHLHSPTAFNCRTTGPIGGNGYPGDMMARSEFPLGATRYQLIPVSESYPGAAWTFSYLSKTEEQALSVIRQGLREGAYAQPLGKNARGLWLPHLHKAFSLPEKAVPSLLPVHAENKVWHLPGLLAWNRGGIYGASFYEVTDSDRSLSGLMGGGPTVLWSEPVGSFLVSMQPSRPVANREIRSPGDFTFSCVYREDDNGAFAHNGQQPATLSVVKEGRLYRIDSRLGKNGPPVIWEYAPTENGLNLRVRLKETATVDGVFLNLPLYLPGVSDPQGLYKNGAVEYKNNGKGIRISWNETASATFKPSSLKDTHRLVIPLPSDDEPLVVIFSTTEQKQEIDGEAPL